MNPKVLSSSGFVILTFYFIFHIKGASLSVHIRWQSCVRAFPFAVTPFLFHITSTFFFNLL